MRNSIFASTLVILNLPMIVHADSGLSVGHLKAICSDRTESAKLMCNSYMQGFLGGASWALLFTKDLPSARYCLPPDGVTIRRVVTIFLDYADRSPETINEPAHIELYGALRDEFPCQ